MASRRMMLSNRSSRRIHRATVDRPCSSIGGILFKPPPQPQAKRQMNKSTLFVLVVSLLFGAPALAQPHAPALSNVLSAQDLETAFENDGQPMELALLSEKEMAETKGALIPLAVLRAVYGGVTGAFTYFMYHDLYPSFDGRGVFRHFVYGGTIGAMSTSPLAAALAAAGVAVVARGYDPDYR